LRIQILPDLHADHTPVIEPRLASDVALVAVAGDVCQIIGRGCALLRHHLAPAAPIVLVPGDDESTTTTAWKSASMDSRRRRSTASPLTGRHRPQRRVHGHTHASFDCRIAATPIAYNPHGDAGESPDFDPLLIVET
jgi:hypothetical protein